MSRFTIILWLAFAATVFGQETTAERLSVLDKNEAAVRLTARRSLTSEKAQPSRQSATLNCADPLFAATRGGGIRMLCDLDNDGTADAMTMFYDLPVDTGNFISAMASSRSGNTMFVATDSGSILRLTDTNRDGIVDAKVIENPGLAYTERLVPHFDNTVTSVYSESSQTGRFNLYFLEANQTRVQGGDLPRGARRIAGSVALPNVGIIFIDPTENTVRRITYNGVGYLDNENSRNDVWYKGYRVSSIAVDGLANLLFVLEAGSCGDIMPVPAGPPTNGISNTAALCTVPTIHILRILGNATAEIGSVSASALQVTYNFTGHPMVARNGKLYVAVYSTPLNDRGSGGEQLLEFRYDQVTGKMNNNPSIFADSQMLGEWAFIGAIATFDGGPVPVQ